MVLITIVNGVYKPSYNWGAPPCTTAQDALFHLGYQSDATQRRRTKIYENQFLLDA